MTKNKPKLIVVVGPTASGKTALGIHMAQKIKGAVVSADSRQIYSGMDIGTASPLRSGQAPHDILTPDMVEGVPHYLFNVASPDKPWPLSEWQQAARRVITEIGNWKLEITTTPILVGGTMLYADSIVYGFDIPDVPPNEILREKLEQKTAEELYAELLAKDPEAGKFVEGHNKRRIIRALEVMATTGRPFSAQRQKRETGFDTEWIGVFPQPSPEAPAGKTGWEVLRERVTARVKAMVEEGLLEETKALQEKYGRDLPLLKTMNYLQAAAMLGGTLTKEQAIEEMIKVNMRYAHRQMSWWRRNAEIEWNK